MLLAVAEAPSRAPTTCCRAASGSKMASVSSLKMFTAGGSAGGGGPGPPPPPRHSDVAGRVCRMGPRAPAEIERLLVEVEHPPRRSLEVSRMGVIVRTGIQRGQEQGHGPLLDGQRLADPLP